MKYSLVIEQLHLKVDDQPEQYFSLSLSSRSLHFDFRERETVF